MSDEVDTRLRSLVTLARALTRSDRFDGIVEISAEEARRAVGAASVSISRIEPGGLLRTLVNVGDLGPGEERWPVDEVYDLAKFNSLRAVVEGMQTWTSSLADPDVDPMSADLMRSLEKVSAMGAPIVVDGTLWGEFYATRDANQVPFADSETTYLEALAAIVSFAIARALQVQSLERIAFLDPLTGVGNRRSMDETVHHALGSLAVGRTPVCVALVDANGLKAVNDRHGHSEGDRFLRLIAGCLVDHFAALPGSAVARIGGDEFCITTVGHPVDQVIRVASDMVEASYALGLGGGVACGVAAVDLHSPSRMRSAKELYQAADRAQYAAKRTRSRHAIGAQDLPEGLTA